MKEKELRQMKRAELIEVIYQLKQSELDLQARVNELEKTLEDRRFRLENIGSIAEASIAVTNIFAEAQAAADVYLVEAQKKAESTQAECDRMRSDAKKECDAMLREANEKLEVLTRKTAEVRKELMQALTETPDRVSE